MICYQISDLHIDKGFKLENHKQYLDLFIAKIKEHNNQDNEVLIICDGDIVHKGESKYYETAIEVFDYIKKGLEPGYSVEYVMVPGNHDRCSDDKPKFSNFTSFAKRFGQADYKAEPIHVIEKEQYNMSIVLINTAKKTKDYGIIDYELLDPKLKEAKHPALIVMHHTLMSRFKDDKSAIRDAYDLIKRINDNNVLGILHGHTHGYSDVQVGKNCKVVGAGSFFKYFENCNFQFNIIEVGPESIKKVINCRYQSDNPKITEDIVFEDESKWLFADTSISSAYDRVLNATEYSGGIHNLTISVKMGRKEFFDEVEEKFKKEIGCAEKWLAPESNDEYYYNHGYYMRDESKQGIDYVIEELKRNSTSNRAIISLLKMKKIINHKGGYLPGLSSVQFGFENDRKDELLCTMNLRSLEVSEFLKINIAEIYSMSKKICDAIRSISNIQIVIQAFSAQIMKDFSCFSKAELDTMTSMEIGKLYFEDKPRLVTLLQEKLSKKETIIELEGLCNVKEAIGLYKEQGYEELKKEINNLITSLEKLKTEYGKNSKYDSSVISNLKQEIQRNGDKCLEMLTK